MTNPSFTPQRGRGLRVTARALLTTATAAAFVGAASLSASAAPANEDSVVANVGVSSVITLNVTQSDFDLNGIPESRVVGDDAVTGTVTTNSATGYTVSVQAAADNLHASAAGNLDSIPIAALQVVDAEDDYVPLSNTTSVITHTQATRSALTGDAFSDDYRVDIPDVNSDTYSVTLNYTATALT